MVERIHYNSEMPLMIQNPQNRPGCLSTSFHVCGRRASGKKWKYDINLFATLAFYFSCFRSISHINISQRQERIRWCQERGNFTSKCETTSQYFQQREGVGGESGATPHSKAFWGGLEMVFASVQRRRGLPPSALTLATQKVCG